MFYIIWVICTQLSRVYCTKFSAYTKIFGPLNLSFVVELKHVSYYFQPILLFRDIYLLVIKQSCKLRPLERKTIVLTEKYFCPLSLKNHYQTPSAREPLIKEYSQSCFKKKIQQYCHTQANTAAPLIFIQTIRMFVWAWPRPGITDRLARVNLPFLTTCQGRWNILLSPGGHLEVCTTR